MTLPEYIETPDGVRYTRQLPPNVRIVRPWGDPVMVQYGFDVNNLPTTNFQAIGLFNLDTATWGAVSNFVRLDHSDMAYLQSIQPTDDPLNTVEMKMNWLVNTGTGKRIYWNGDWRTSNDICWGTLALGGNRLQIAAYESVFAPHPITKAKQYLNMGRLEGFTHADRSRPLADLINEGLVHRAYCVGSNNELVDSPNGLCWTPFYDPTDWRIGSVRDSQLYILEDWLE